jgi:hypothetical protein
MTSPTLSQIRNSGEELFPKNTVTIIHDGDDSYVYVTVIRAEDEPVFLGWANRTPEEALESYLARFRLTNPLLWETDYTLNHLDMERAEIRFRTSFDDFLHRLKMQELLGLPLIDIMEAV